MDGNGAIIQGDFVGNGTDDPPDDATVTYAVLGSSRGKGSSGLVPLMTGICDIGHQGLFFDKEWGTYHNRAREYHPTLMRFMQPDPIGYPIAGYAGQSKDGKYWYDVEYRDIRRAQRYKMAYGLFFACFSQEAKDMHQLVHDGPNSVFVGFKGKLTPVFIPFYPGKFDSGSNAVERTLPWGSGKQGTKTK